MTTIFLNEKPSEVRRVYAEHAPQTVYCKQDLLDRPEAFQDTQYVFSTWGMPVMTAEEIRRCLPQLKAVFYAAGSVQAFARPFLECGVRVFSAWAANGIPVAEYTVAQILLANKGFFRSSVPAKRGDRSAAKAVFSHYPGNYDTTVGIIGVGMIGQMVCAFLKAYQLNVLVFDPFLSDVHAKSLGVRKTTLEDLFSRCQVVSNHLANNEQTKGMLTGKHFASMPPYATFLNTGRGAQVVEEELIQVLKDRPDLTAILDVTWPEPPVADSPFYQLENCILTPHIAGSSGNEVHRMAAFMLEEHDRLIHHEPCQWEVSLEMLKTMA